MSVWKEQKFDVLNWLEQDSLSSIAIPSVITLLEKNPDKINWDNLSLNPAAIHLLEKNPDKINWDMLSLNPAAISLLEKNPEKISWWRLSLNTAAVNLLEKNPEKIDWHILCLNPEAIYLLAKNTNKISRNFLETEYPDVYSLLQKHLNKITHISNSRKKYLITGITGFLGPHLANELVTAGHEVFGLVRINMGRENDIRDIIEDSVFSKLNFVYADLTNYRALRKVFEENKFDGVFHLAAQTHPPTSFTDPIGTWDWNVMGSINLITVIKELQSQLKFVFCSTVEVYGNTGIDTHKLKETDTLIPANPYGASKAAIDLYIQERINNKQMNAVIVRPFCFTGPRRGSTFSISSDALQIARMKLNKQDKILRVGNLDTSRAVTDVRDIASAFRIVMDHPNTSGEIFNVCGGEPKKMRFFTETLIKLAELQDVKMEIDSKLWRPIDIQYQDGDANKLMSFTGWKPKYKIEETLKDLLEYWLKKLS